MRSRCNESERPAVLSAAGAKCHHAARPAARRPSADIAREESMPRAALTACVVAGALAAFLAQAAQGQAPAPALSGTIASDREGAMEGVLVSARREGSTITVTVVSDARGEFAFPASRLEPGQYRLTILPSISPTRSPRAPISSSRTRLSRPTSSPIPSGWRAPPVRTSSSVRC